MKIFQKNSKTSSSLAQADAARDGGMPAKAAELYDKYLTENPKNADIWVQAGNAYKDAGAYKDAMERYSKALELKPEESDTYVQRGHLLKLMQRQMEAVESYKLALKHNPANQDALKELAAADALEGVFKQEATTLSSAPTIWLDITDLMVYVEHNGSLTGIQRVVANLILHVEKGIFGAYRVIPVIPDYGNKRIFAANSAALLMLVKLFDEPVVDRNLLNKAIQAVHQSKREVWPQKGDIFSVAGAFWIYPNYDIIRELRENGMRFCVFIHDLIQISNPEYVAKDALVQFQTQLIDVLSCCDFVLTNSHFVAGDVEKYIAQNLNYTLPVKAVPLPTELRKKSGPQLITDRRILGMRNEEYVLSVSTIEIRKNHMFLIRTWEKLIREYGEENVPKLVFVGKWGWQIDELRNYLESKGYIGDWLYIFNGISDDELEFLYKNSLFTAYTSFAEGFGLPIGESLVYGKPCIASNTTSMPEVGGRFVRYIDPYNVEGGYEVFRKPIMDRKDLSQWEKDIRLNFRPKTWAEFCDEFFSDAISYAEQLGDRPASLNCLLPPGQLIQGGTTALLRLAFKKKPIITFRAARSRGWYYMENWGAWSAERRSQLLFDTPLKEGNEVRIYLNICCPPGSAEPEVIAKAGSEHTSHTLSEQPGFFAFKGIVGPDGQIKIDLLARGKFGPTGHRSCYIGLQAIGYSLNNDPLTRMDLIEQITTYQNLM
ncbi:glycosyltransferase [Gluconobacter morbifer]|uniref:Glycosyl transferase family 1 domain-containing protein n=1 Tax=Gluconobacter morbifer G707 TaxID=1088869 RepID=G6XLU2_9PROT|nr:glycosyltransferase [Gluconobacter morbifer]EHH67347.1 hypothetical protein GMO_23410 [Gluconobacter morbifer G707]